MANTVIGASVEIEYKSIKDLKTALEETERQFKEMVDTFGEGSKEAMASQKKLASLQDGINQKTEEYNQKVDAAAATVSALNATVGGLQGALELTGLASEETEKALAKVTAALSIGDAIQNLTEFGPAIKQTFNTISAGAKTAFTTMKTVAVQAFTSIRGALVATGIGALVVALGTIVAYWDDIKAAVSGVSEEQKKLNKESEANLKAQRGKLDAISKQENTLKLQGKSEKEILKSKIDQTNQTIKAAEINLKNSIQTQKSQVAAAKRNKEILEGLIAFVSLPITTVLKGIDLIGQAVGKNFDLYGKFTGGLASLVFDPDQVKADGDASIKAQEDALVDLKNQRDGFILQSQNQDKKSNGTKTATAKTTNDELIRIEKEAQEALLKSRMTAQERELFELKKGYDEKKKVLEQGGKSTNALTEVYEKQKGEIEAKYKKLREQEEDKFQNIITQLVQRKQAERNLTEQETARQAVVDKYAKEREELLKQYPNNLQLMILLKQNEQKELDAVDEQFKQKKLEKDAATLLTESSNQELTFQQRIAKIKEREQLINEITFKSEEEKTAFIKANSDARVKIAQEEANAIVQAADAVANTLTNASKILGENTKAGKALAIASATISMFTSAQKAYAATVGIPYVGPILAPINAALAIAAGIKNIKEIGKVKVPGGGGGGGSVPNPTPPPPGNMNAPLSPTLSSAVQGQALNSQAINNLGNQSLRAYVMNSDIQNNNQRNAYLERNARIG